MRVGHTNNIKHPRMPCALKVSIAQLRGRCNSRSNMHRDHVTESTDLQLEILGSIVGGILVGGMGIHEGKTLRHAIPRCVCVQSEYNTLVSLAREWAIPQHVSIECLLLALTQTNTRPRLKSTCTRRHKRSPKQGRTEDAPMQSLSKGLAARVQPLATRVTPGHPG